jgi:hypothetical protein
MFGNIQDPKYRRDFFEGWNESMPRTDVPTWHQKIYSAVFYYLKQL